MGLMIFATIVLVTILACVVGGAVWLGGRIFDATGSYDIVWMIAIGLGVASAVIHLPISERPIDQTAQGGPDGGETSRSDVV